MPPRELTSRRISPCLFRYVAGNYALPLLCCLLGFAALFLLNNVFDGMNDILKAKMPTKYALLFFLAQQPQHLALVAPISSLLAASFMTLMMGRNNELTAIRAAGISLAAAGMPVWILAAILCAVTMAVNESWGARCARYAASLEERYLDKKANKEGLAFHNPSAHRDWSFQVFRSDGTSESVLVRQYDKHAASQWLLSAQTATWSPSKGWIFRNGALQYFAPDGVRLEAGTVFFQERVEAFPETPDDMRSHSIDWNLMNIRELLQVRRAGIVKSKRAQNRLLVLLWNRITFPLASLIGALFGVSLTIANGRSGLVKGFATAILLLVLFYLVGQLFLVLGKNGWLPAFLAGAASNLAFLAIGITLMWNKR
ncbi:MAG: LptF/LptG family permease [Victivallales bacterium]|nr:LptF/LptG family permease [Victivallales bacterium]